ncbi:MAG: metallophosphoesterase [Pseudoxanthomonas sp.]
MKLHPKPRTSSWRTLRRVVATVALLAVVLLLVALSRAEVESSASGVHQRLLFPLGQKAIGIQSYAGTGDRVFIAGHLDGPIVRMTGRDTWRATWFCQDRAQHASGRGATLTLACGGARHTFALGAAAIPPAIAPMPGRLVVLSDIEGNRAFMEGALRRLGVVDAAGNWAYAQGRLVILGDAMDRGRDVFAVLWRLHALSLQAQAAGGAVHVVLGNHEQYALQGNVSRANAEHRYALNAMGGYAAAFGADTVIGHWLREQPVALRLGRVLFVHGGISPDMLASGLDVDGLNRAMRDYWRLGNGASLAPAKHDALFGLSGITRYRGYFQPLDGHYPVATRADVERALDHFAADQIVVAHTLVDRLTPRYDGRVMAIDVNDNQALPEVLVYHDGVPDVVDIGIARGLPDRETPRSKRRFQLLRQDDWRLLIDMGRAFWALSRIPAAD